MKKIILSLALVVILALVGGLYYLYTNLDSLVKVAIEKYGSEATQTAVRVESVRFQLGEGAGAIHGLTVANPAGFNSKYAFSLGEIKTGINLKSINEEPYIIDEITVRAPEVFVDINKDRKINLNELKNNLMAAVPQSKTGGKAEKQEKPAEKTASAEPRLIIRRVSFTEGTIKALVAPLNNKEYKLKLPNIRMKNLGGKRGATPTELSKEILERLIDTAKQEVQKQGINAELDKLKAKAREKLEAEKAKIESKIEAEKDKAEQQLEEEKLKAVDKLKGLFGQ